MDFGHLLVFSRNLRIFVIFQETPETGNFEPPLSTIEPSLSSTTSRVITSYEPFLSTTSRPPKLKSSKSESRRLKPTTSTSVSTTTSRSIVVTEPIFPVFYDLSPTKPIQLEKEEVLYLKIYSNINKKGKLYKKPSALIYVVTILICARKGGGRGVVEERLKVHQKNFRGGEFI